MKRFLTLATYAMMVVALPLTFTSCGDSDDDDDIWSPSEVHDYVIPGYWTTKVPGEKETAFIRFGLDGTMTTALVLNGKVVDDETQTGKWAFTPASSDNAKSGTLAITFYDGKDEETEKMEVSFKDRNTMKVTVEEEDEDTGEPIKMTITFKRSKTFPVETGDVPTTAAAAKKMVEGQWRYPASEFPDYADELYCEFNSNGKYYQIVKVSKDAPSDKWYSSYKGQYIGYIWWNSYTVSPSNSKPAEGTIEVKDSETSSIFNYSELSAFSMKRTDGTSKVITFSRPAAPVKYTVVKTPDE